MYSLSRFLQITSRNSSTFTIENILNKNNLTRTAEKFANMTSIRLQQNEPRKRAAVLVPLCTVGGSVSLLYTLRAACLKSHRGQVSFPGGMWDPDDESLEYTAVRETTEELGINKDDIEIVGKGKLIVARSDVSVLPVIGQIKNELTSQSLTINKSEVEDVFAVSIEDLCNTKFSRYTQFQEGFSFPVFLAGDTRIWGLTALITHEFLKALSHSVAYTNKIKIIPKIEDFGKPINVRYY